MSTTLTDPLPWENSTLIGQDVIPALNSVKAAQPGDLVITGSGVLVRSLLPHAVIDRLVLLIHPLVLGHGQRVFPDGGPSLRWQLTAGRSTSRGVFAATCDRPAQV
ncbi:dihydrofolate reductase family protein [Deinococcus sp.]|uniref:dihydrofolate reductase family protein n=1 Tax=Deinococcus sp. TaxID=47478 RepID=UPI0028699736|nr:dihydrofolate reductase family protein [Deinococcus sp.]